MTKQLSLPPNFTFHSTDFITPISRKNPLKPIEIIQGSSLSSISQKVHENDDCLSIISQTSTQQSPLCSENILHHRSNTLPTRHRRSQLSPMKDKPESTNSQSLLQIPSKHRRRDDQS